jgi:hypothetical protein
MLSAQSHGQGGIVLNEQEPFLLPAVGKIQSQTRVLLNP